MKRTRELEREELELELNDISPPLVERSENDYLKMSIQFDLWDEEQESGRELTFDEEDAEIERRLRETKHNHRKDSRP